VTPFGIEPVTFWLVVRRSTNCATLCAFLRVLWFYLVSIILPVLHIFHSTPTIYNHSKWQHCQIKHTFKKWKWLWNIYWTSWVPWYESAMLKSSFCGWFVKNFVFEPLSCGALIFSECTFTAFSNVMDMISWNNTPCVLQTFQTYFNIQIVHLSHYHMPMTCPFWFSWHHHQCIHTIFYMNYLPILLVVNRYIILNNM
jgi:hypothetical protein